MTDVVLDVDTGVDDALALLVAVRHPALRVRAISCVAGNVGVEQVVFNTLTVLEHAGAPDIPVAAGARRPLVAPARDATHVHGADGMAELGLPRPDRTPVREHAVQLLHRTIRTAPEPVTVIALAPLTNIALLVRTYPEVLGNVERIVMMGGSAGVGNASPVAEFNTWHDPEATAIVLNAEVPVTMYGLDVFYQVTVGAADVEMLATYEDAGARLAGMLCRHQIAVCGHDPRLAGDALIGDAGAVCAVADPAGLVIARLPVQVELAPGLSRGQTVVDRRPVPGEEEGHGLSAAAPRHDVALGVDDARYRSLFLETVTVTTKAG